MPDRQPPQLWCLVRLDDNGNEFVVRDGLDRDAAEALARTFEARGHKQSYWIRAQGPGAEKRPEAE
jgi:hypothetical protein